MAGGGVTAVVSTADAIFAPLALRQVVRSRTIDVQTARNDALLSVAEAYFNVQQARGQLAGAADAVAKARDLERTVQKLGKDLVAPIEVDRVRTELADRGAGGGVGPRAMAGGQRRPDASAASGPLGGGPAAGAALATGDADSAPRAGR